MLESEIKRRTSRSVALRELRKSYLRAAWSRDCYWLRSCIAPIDYLAGFPFLYHLGP
jgi:hypothetical protein